MEAYPHRYNVQASGETVGSVLVQSDGLPTLTTAPPRQFGGPGDQWSPETLLVAAAADCFILTFQAIATASKLPWRHLECDAEGILNRVDGVVRFSELRLNVRHVLTTAEDVDRAKRLLEKAEGACLITNSLAFRPTLSAEITAEP
jgi:peroxiredoxin-like protein